MFMGDSYKYTLELNFKEYTAEFKSVLILLEFTLDLQFCFLISSTVQNQELVLISKDILDSFLMSHDPGFES